MRVARRRWRLPGLPLPALLGWLSRPRPRVLVARASSADAVAARHGAIVAAGMAARSDSAGCTALRAEQGRASSPVERNQIVAYYGGPRTPSMGILGQHAPEDVADLLAQRAERIDASNAQLGVLPALHLVYAVAQPEPRVADCILRYVDDRTVRQFIAWRAADGFVTILDLQIGHSGALDEVSASTPYSAGAGCVRRARPGVRAAGGAASGRGDRHNRCLDINDVQAYLGAARRGTAPAGEDADRAPVPGRDDHERGTIRAAAATSTS